MIRTLDHSGERPNTSERADLAHSSSDTVELATNRSGACLCGEHTETVTRSEFAETQEDTVDHGEGADVDGEPSKRKESLACGDMMDLWRSRTYCL